MIDLKLTERGGEFRCAALQGETEVARCAFRYEDYLQHITELGGENFDLRDGVLRAAFAHALNRGVAYSEIAAAVPEEIREELSLPQGKPICLPLWIEQNTRCKN